MKKFFAIVLAVLLLCNLSTVAFADSDLSLISCPELGFTTMADSSYPWKYVEGDGITIWTESEGYIPFVLVWQSEDLIAEPLDFIKEQYTPSIEEKYGSDFVDCVEYETYDIGGKQLPAGLYTYRVQGQLVEMLRLYDSTGERTVAYTAKYLQNEGDETLAALDTAIRNFKADDTSNTSEASNPNALKTSKTQNTETPARSFTLTPITWDGAGLGKVAVPDGFDMDTEVHCSDETTCFGSLLRVNVGLTSSEEPVVLSFGAPETYIERVKTNYPSIFPHVDGQLDGQTSIFMRRYKNAEQYCDWRAKALDATFYKDEDTSFLNEELEPYREEYISEIKSGFAQYGIGINWCEATVAQRVYTYEANGTTWAFCILATARGYEYEAAGEVSRQWEVPAFYTLTCPIDDYQKAHDELFMPFVENTAVSDTFIQLEDDLTYQMRDKTIEEWRSQVAASSAYAAAMSAFMSASVDSYLQSSSYSSSSRFTDYIFDRNTYTTSDGYNVSVSTSYDYVWESGNGTVYYSDSAFDVPSGAILLDPN